MAGKVYDWFDARLKLKPFGQALLDEPILGGGSWFYVFASATLFLFCLEATTGMFLSLYDVPSPDVAYDTAQVPKLDPSIARGKALLAQHHCLTCHELHGEGGKVGPDLSYVGNRRTDRDWHIRHLRGPVSPGSIMPKFPLSDREMNDLASYLLGLKGEPAAPTDGTLERDETEYARLLYVGVALSRQACSEAEERKEQI
jgi:mono/diheme cytochrome c family protein